MARNTRSEWVQQTTSSFHSVFFVAIYFGFRDWMRVLTSNSVSVPLDSARFRGLALVGRMPFAVVVCMFVANIVAKGITTIISLPWMYLVRERRPAAAG
jgi:hypothetical protein